MRLRNILLTCLLLGACGCFSGRAGARRGGDVYPDFTALKAAHTAGLDYSSEVYERGSDVAVFAIHGGDIEAATSRVARSVAGKDFNLYIFNGWLGGESGRLHVTATHFDDPEALRLAAASVLGISLHAQTDRGAWICVGGRNTAAAALIARRLEDAGFAVEAPCLRLPGTSEKNIVNRSSAGGVQLELTLRLLERLENNRDYLSKFSEAVRTAALESLALVKARARQ
ncbi:MAG TPA: replication protein [Elusimicrobia bacterium]|nr:replication protein [Elusimicrobiota bacterium]